MLRELFDAVRDFHPTLEQINLLESLWGKHSELVGLTKSADTARIAWTYLRTPTPANIPTPLMLGYLINVLLPNLTKSAMNPAIVPRTAIVIRALLGARPSNRGNAHIVLCYALIAWTGDAHGDA